MKRDSTENLFFRVVVFAFVVLTLPALCRAGTLCGTVRDGATGTPIADAGVFLRRPAGDYTGLSGATQPSGCFCIGAVPAGTYDLEVRHDDYLVAYRRGVIVDNDPTSVDVLMDGPTVLRTPWPNPARRAVTLAFRLSAAGPVRLTVHDLRGRLVQGWQSELPAGAHAQAWSFLNRDGRRVPPGVYWVRLTTGAFVRTRTLVHLPE